MTPTLKQQPTDLSDYEGVDIRNGGGVVFCAPTTYKYPNGDIKQYVDLGGILNFLQRISRHISSKGVALPNP